MVWRARSVKAYLDIETSYSSEITVIGAYRPDAGVVQLTGRAVTVRNLLWMLEGVHTIYTYNGERFDLPVIRRVLGVDLRGQFRSCDLMYACWRQGLYGGLKKVEMRLGIGRVTEGLDGRDAMRLWESYCREGDGKALDTLLLYNREDILNLSVLEARLAGLPAVVPLGVDVQVLRA